MAIDYLLIKRSLALRLAQISGSNHTTLETSYTSDWATMLDGAEIPRSAFKDQILSVERELATMIGNNPQHPARTQLYGRSANLVNLASTPAVDNVGTEFVGVFDSCADSETSEPLTWVPPQTIEDYKNSFFNDLSLFNYNINGNQIQHTRDLAYLQGVVWSYSNQSDSYDLDDGVSPLPQGLMATWIDGVTARAAQVGWVDGAGVAGYYAGLYQQGMAVFNGSAPSHLPLSAQANQAAG